MLMVVLYWWEPCYTVRTETTNWLKLFSEKYTELQIKLTCWQHLLDRWWYIPENSKTLAVSLHVIMFWSNYNRQIGWPVAKHWTLWPAGAPLSSSFRCDPLWGGAQSHVLCSQWQPGWTVLPGRESGEHRGSSPSVSTTHLPLCWLWYVCWHT